MIYLYHSYGKRLNSVFNDGVKVDVVSNLLVNAFWEIASRFPDELIIWRDEEIEFTPNSNLEKVFHHHLIMASYAVKTQFIPDTIGYVDQLPFVNPKYNVQYPTWRMSTDIGGIYGKTAIRFKIFFGNFQSFGFLINSIAKVGQQNGLFCYSNPEIVSHTVSEKLQFSASQIQFYEFISRFYNKEWLWVLFFCQLRYEKKTHFYLFLKNYWKRSFFNISIDLPINEISQNNFFEDSIDIIIPSFYRSDYVLNLLKDLCSQTKLPEQVIIVEQEPNLNEESMMGFINQKWPFKVIHHFTRITGACHARNLALESVKSEYIFLADDDIRIEKHLIEKAIREINRLGVDCLNLNSIQPGEEHVFHKIKQWGAFGSGTAIVSSKYALKCRFSEFLEKGFGEDIDFGLQLRAIGCDIIYHPYLNFIHLKAERGGFREILNNIDNEGLAPKPSPTMMYLVKTRYNSIMQKGYKISLFLKYYSKQEIKNPFRYFTIMQERWQLSEAQYLNLLNQKTKFE